MESIIIEVIYIVMMFVGIILYEAINDKCIICFFGQPFFPDLFQRKWTRKKIQDWLAFLFLFVFSGVLVSFRWAYVKFAILGILVLHQSYTLRMLKISCFVRKKLIRR